MYKVADLKKAIDVLIGSDITEVDIIADTKSYRDQPISYTLVPIDNDNSKIGAVKVRMSSTVELKDPILEKLLYGGAIVTYQEKL